MRNVPRVRLIDGAEQQHHLSKWFWIYLDSLVSGRTISISPRARRLCVGISLIMRPKLVCKPFILPVFSRGIICLLFVRDGPGKQRSHSRWAEQMYENIIIAGISGPLWIYVRNVNDLLMNKWACHMVKQ